MSTASPNAFADAARDRKANLIVLYLIRRLIATVQEQTDDGWISILAAAEVKAEKAPSEESRTLIIEKLRRLERIHRIL